MLAKSPANYVSDSPMRDAHVVADPAPTLQFLSLFWRQKWYLLAGVTVCLGIAIAYIKLATPIYLSYAVLHVSPEAPRIMVSDNQWLEGKSDTFLNTQASVIKSEPVVGAAVANINFKNSKTFAHVVDPVDWLVAGKDLDVEPGRLEDVITISLESPDPREAADLVNAIADSYVSFENKEKRATADEVLKILENEKQERTRELAARTQTLKQFGTDHGGLPLQSDKENIMIDRLAKLSDSLTAATLQTIAAETAYQNAKSVMDSPDTIHRCVSVLRAQESPDLFRELDALDDALRQRQTVALSSEPLYGTESYLVQINNVQKHAIESQIAAEESRIASAYQDRVEAQYLGAKHQEASLRATVEQQKAEVAKFNSEQALASDLQGDVDRVKKQLEYLDQRMEEVSVEQNGGALNIQLLQSAHLGMPVKPRKTMALAYGLIVGLLGGGAMALGREWLCQRFQHSNDVGLGLALSVMGEIPHVPGRKSLIQRAREIQFHSGSEVSEAYRTIRTHLLYSGSGGFKTLLVTSPQPEDGKSMVATNLAIAFAQIGQRVLLIDADLRRPVLHTIFGLSEKIGISSVVAGRDKLRDSIFATDIHNLSVLPCGPLPAQPSEMIASDRFTQVMDSLPGSFDRVIIDSPPVSAVSDPLILAASADATLLVVRMKWTPRKICALAIKNLQRVGANVAGVVVNDTYLTGERIRYKYSVLATQRSIGLADSQGRLIPAGSVESDKRLPDDFLDLKVESVNGHDRA